MTIRVLTETGLQTGARLRFATPAGLKRALRLSMVNASLGLDPVFSDLPTLSATATPNPASFFTTANTTVQGDLSIAVVGGMAPISYSAVVLSSSYSTAILNPTTPNPTLRQTGVIAETTGTATIQLVISDISGQSVTINVPAEFTNFGGA